MKQMQYFIICASSFMVSMIIWQKQKCQAVPWHGHGVLDTTLDQNTECGRQYTYVYFLEKIYISKETNFMFLEA